MFVWRAGGDGRYQLEIPVPVKPLDSNQHRAKLGSTAGNWTAVCWAEPKLLLASSSWGELISWDFTMGAKGKPMCKLVHANHVRGLFCIANVPSKVSTEEENWRESKPYGKQKQQRTVNYVCYNILCTIWALKVHGKKCRRDNLKNNTLVSADLLYI